jgi:uncharacterized membrane protein YphA (DoxX/SURF4 family)
VVLASGREKPLDLGVRSRAIEATLVTGMLFVRRRLRLQKLFSTFPDGWPGLGLILMRLTVALSAIAQAVTTLIGSPAQPLSWAIGVLEILVGAALLMGFLTPFAGASASLGNLAMGVSRLLTSGGNMHEKAAAAIYLSVISMAITLLGPGSSSLDARLFGRREIIIPETSRPPHR